MVKNKKNNIIVNHSNKGGNDAPLAYQFLFQDPATPIMEGIIDFHHDLMFLITFITFFVLSMLVETTYTFNRASEKRIASFFINEPKTNYKELSEDLSRVIPQKNAKEHLNAFTHHTLLEIVWTVTPSFILLLVAIPSFSLLYSIDDMINPSITLKVVGRQWYWTYEYSDYATTNLGNTVIESYMIPEEELDEGYYRLLETTNRTVLPINSHIRALTTAADVLHSWAIPSLGVKMDACPGRLNELSIFIKREGVYYGPCSEICGIYHGFMPITIDAVNLKEYTTWLYYTALGQSTG